MVELSRTVGVVLHIYYEDVALDILDRLVKMNRPIHRLIITHSEPLGEAVVMKALTVSRDVRFKKFSNRGRDVEPFLNVLQAGDLAGCEYTIKLHTKDWRTPVGMKWYFEMLHNQVGPAAYDAILEAFEANYWLGMIGPKITWLCAQHFMYENAKNVFELQRGVWNLPRPEKDSWGFFAGTMFWFRTRTLSIIGLRWSSSLAFDQELVFIDGAPEHAYERFFGYHPDRTLVPVGLINLTKDGPVIEYDASPSKVAITKTLTRKYNLVNAEG